MNKWTRVKFQPNLPLRESGRVTASKEHILLSKEAAKEGMVLLKNEKNLLPLTEGTRIALFGKGSFDYVTQPLRWAENAGKRRSDLRTVIRFLPHRYPTSV